MNSYVRSTALREDIFERVWDSFLACVRYYCVSGYAYISVPLSVFTVSPVVVDVFLMAHCLIPYSRCHIVYGTI